VSEKTEPTHVLVVIHDAPNRYIGLIEKDKVVTGKPDAITIVQNVMHLVVQLVPQADMATGQVTNMKVLETVLPVDYADAPLPEMHVRLDQVIYYFPTGEMLNRTWDAYRKAAKGENVSDGSVIRPPVGLDYSKLRGRE